MARSWAEECMPHLRISPNGGRTALCVLWYLLKELPQDEIDDFSVVGNVRTPLGISWFLRGLWQLPYVEDVVVWGPDLTRTGEAMIRLWRDGIGNGHRIPGENFGWKLDPHVDCDSIDELRRYVRLIDARGVRSVRDISRAQSDVFSTEVPRREKRDFPIAEVPARVVLPSRGVFAPLVAKNLGHAWIEVLNTVMSCGDVRQSRKSETQIHFFGISVVFPVSEQESIPAEFDVTAADIETYAASFMKAVRPSGLHYHYGERVFNYRGHNQVDELISRLRGSLDTKRGTLAVLEVPDLEELEDAPCWCHMTFAVNQTDQRLSSFAVFRSHDVYEGWPLNVLMLLRLYRHIWQSLQDLGVRLGYFAITSENAQVYERHAGAALDKIARFGVSPENVKKYVGFENDLAGNFIFVIEPSGKIRARMTSFTGDEILWEREESDPARLIRWIVARHPWLASDHIRYLGVEEEKLRIALQKGEPYVQG